jgi:hypothetical protein
VSFEGYLPIAAAKHPNKNAVKKAVITSAKAGKMTPLTELG